ncbi:MAG: hypothetical protein Q4B99_07030 [Clostridia bacterium]|nr:hypothetical protein [Clostridia bacterium]
MEWWRTDMPAACLQQTRPNHYAMGHIIAPKEIVAAQGYAVMGALIPIRLVKRP